MARLHHTLYRRIDGRVRPRVRRTGRGFLEIAGEGDVVVGYLASDRCSDVVPRLQIHPPGTLPILLETCLADLLFFPVPVRLFIVRTSE